MIGLSPPGVRRRKGPDPTWVVPSHLRGLHCRLCGEVFKDGDDHGRLDFTTSALICRVDRYPGIPYRGVRPIVDLEGVATCFRPAVPAAPRPTGKLYRTVFS